jgi:hypothetical protein
MRISIAITAVVQVIRGRQPTTLSMTNAPLLSPADLAGLHLPWPVSAGLVLALASLTVLGHVLSPMAPAIPDPSRRLAEIRHTERMAARYGTTVQYPLHAAPRDQPAAPWRPAMTHPPTPLGSGAS